MNMYSMYIMCCLLVRKRGTQFPAEEVESNWCDCDWLSLTANRGGEELMELSTTNGHISIDYLFIYLSIFWVLHSAYSIVLQSKQLVSALKENKTLDASVFCCILFLQKIWKSCYKGLYSSCLFTFWSVSFIRSCVVSEIPSEILGI